VDSIREVLEQHVTLHQLVLRASGSDDIPLASIEEAITEAQALMDPAEPKVKQTASFCNVEVPYFIGGNQSTDAIKSLSHLVSDAMSMAAANVPVELELSLGKITNSRFDSTITALMFDCARNFISAEASQAGFQVFPSYTIIDRICNSACTSCYQDVSTCQCQGTEKSMMRHRTMNRSGSFEASLIFKQRVSRVDLMPAQQSSLSQVIMHASSLTMAGGCATGTLYQNVPYDRQKIARILGKVANSRIYFDRQGVTFVNVTTEHAMQALAQTLRTTRCDDTSCKCKSLDGCECPSVIRANLKTETPIAVDDESVLGFNPDRCTFAYAIETRKDEWTIRLRSKVTKHGIDCVTLAERHFAESSKDSDREFDIEIEMNSDDLLKYRNRYCTHNTFFIFSYKHGVDTTISTRHQSSGQ